ncbi:Ubiquitin-like protein [Mycoemilia scoparia]|uniref:Ubiquitin-like protein ATG12 n=1 Tax=Mycoemilia scoparia TaxID=417184 RepID=A0A9W7ZZB4_9FUNG|nr:Ubiquitin-like protein [Mycoemilia scoparia]
MSSSATTAATQPPKKPPSSKDAPKKTVVRFRSIGNAPILKKSIFKITSTQKLQALVVFLRKELGYKPSEPLFVYVNSAFSPAPDETVANLEKMDN